MTSRQALSRARAVLGPDAIVQERHGVKQSMRYVVGISPKDAPFPCLLVRGMGPSWEQALRAAEIQESP